ncbi:hypothetical protein FRC12_014038, partial [Ceratobasidium sp. 428]
MPPVLPPMQAAVPRHTWAPDVHAFKYADDRDRDWDEYNAHPRIPAAAPAPPPPTKSSRASTSKAASNKRAGDGTTAEPPKKRRKDDQANAAAPPPPVAVPPNSKRPDARVVNEERVSVS